MDNGPYRAYETLAAPARARSGLVRLACGIIMLAVLSTLFQVFILGFLFGALGLEAENGTALETAMDGRSPQAVLAILFSFTGYFAALALVLRLLHKRGLRSVLGPSGPALRQSAPILLALLGLLVLTFLLPIPDALRPTRNAALGIWLPALPLALAALLIQVSAEEFVFRGYLQSQLAGRFPTPVIWLGLPALLFGGLHYAPSVYGENAWAVVVWASLFGLAAGDLTARSGTLGPAITLHLVNNAYAFLLAAPEGYMDGLTLYTYPFNMDDPDQLVIWLPVELLILLSSWLLARLVLRR